MLIAKILLLQMYKIYSACYDAYSFFINRLSNSHVEICSISSFVGILLSSMLTIYLSKLSAIYLYCRSLYGGFAVF